MCRSLNNWLDIREDDRKSRVVPSQPAITPIHTIYLGDTIIVGNPGGPISPWCAAQKGYRCRGMRCRAWMLPNWGQGIGAWIRWPQVIIGLVWSIGNPYEGPEIYLPEIPIPVTGGRWNLEFVIWIIIWYGYFPPHKDSEILYFNLIHWLWSTHSV